MLPEASPETYSNDAAASSLRPPRAKENTHTGLPYRMRCSCLLITSPATRNFTPSCRSATSCCTRPLTYGRRLNRGAPPPAMDHRMRTDSDFQFQDVIVAFDAIGGAMSISGRSATHPAGEPRDRGWTRYSYAASKRFASRR